ncbi:MAG TPA: zf-HC2 domain-containing protein [Gemmatimonadaceae bacterium]|nr:zf-HC2 domain-containing protein [Gemmatimonadaceae bacterium]
MTDLEIAAYLDRGLQREKLDQFEEHLSQCAECRDNLMRTQEVVGRSRRSSRFIRSGTIILAAAAVALMAVPSLRRWGASEAPVMRGDNGAAPLVAYGPLGEISTLPVRFVWASARDAMSYRITVTRDDGTEVWASSSTDTTVILPSNVSLQNGTNYLWVVDAVSSDGTTRSTGNHQFGFAR